MTRWIYAVCVTFAPTAVLPPGVVLSIRNIRAVNNPADSLPAIGILAALWAFGGVLNKFPALTTSGSSTCFVVTASAGHQSMEVVILTDWREQFLRPYRMGRLTRCSMRSRNFSRGFVMAPSRIEFWQQFFSPISSTLRTTAATPRHCAKGVGAVPWPGGEHGGGWIAFDGPGRAIRCGMSISRQVRSLGIDTVSRPSSRNSLSEGARVQNSRLNLDPHTPGNSQGVCGHP